MALNLIVMMGLYGAIYSPLSKVLRLGDAVMENLKTVYAAAMNVDMAKQGTRYELNLLHEFARLSDNASQLFCRLSGIVAVLPASRI